MYKTQETWNKGSKQEFLKQTKSEGEFRGEDISMFWAEGCRSSSSSSSSSSSTPSLQPPKCPEQKEIIKNVEDSHI
jgi:hypothetical protein